MLKDRRGKKTKHLNIATLCVKKNIKDFVCGILPRVALRKGAK